MGQGGASDRSNGRGAGGADRLPITSARSGEAARSPATCTSAGRVTLQGEDEDQADVQGPARVERAGVEGLRRWAAARARHHSYGSRHRPGHAPGTLRALALAHGHTILCGTSGCRALVDLQAARAAARRDERAHLDDADGCYKCSVHYRPARFKRGQQAMVQAVGAGTRVLVERPETAVARIDLWLMLPAAAAKATQEAGEAAARGRPNATEEIARQSERTGT